jgi:hypothetical protein
MCGDDFQRDNYSLNLIIKNDTFLDTLKLLPWGTKIQSFDNELILYDTINIPL